MNQDTSVNRISLGVLAYNSVDTIAPTIRCLAEQSLVSENLDDSIQVEILILANGCTDATAQFSEKTLQSICFPDFVTWRVCEIERKGKCNAWNEYVHQHSDPESDILIFMDSDIVFLGTNTLKNMVTALKNDPKAIIAVDEPVKDVALKDNPTWAEWLSLQVSDVRRKTNTPTVCGQLYAGKTQAMREIWMPTSLPVEDGFLKAMVLTNGFREQDDFARIIKAKDAAHRFEAHMGTKNLLPHEVWLVASSTVNTFVYEYLWKSCENGQSAGELIRDLNESDPDWVGKMVSQQIKGKFWVVPSSFVFRRFHQMGRISFFRAIPKIPIVLAAFFADLVICFRVNRMLKRNKGGVHYWRPDEGDTDEGATSQSISVPTSDLKRQNSC